MCEQSCQGFDVVWGVCLSQMPWKTLGAHARSCKSGEPRFLLITCGISSRLIEVSAYCCHIPPHQQSGVWKICTQQKGWGRGGRWEVIKATYILSNLWSSAILSLTPTEQRGAVETVCSGERCRQPHQTVGINVHCIQAVCVCVWECTLINTSQEILYARCLHYNHVGEK